MHHQQHIAIPHLLLNVLKLNIIYAFFTFIYIYISIHSTPFIEPHLPFIFRKIVKLTYQLSIVILTVIISINMAGCYHKL